MQSQAMSKTTMALNYALNCMEKEFKDVAGKEEMIEKVTTKFVEISNSPPREDFEFVLRKAFTAEEVCVALFKPHDEQVSYYPLLLNSSVSAPKGHQLSKLLSILLSVLFLVHRKNWDFMKIFISEGGLVPLAYLLDCDNMYIRGQALEILLTATDCDTFDWFKPPDMHSDRILHQKMIELARDPVCLPKLFGNRVGSYPGGSFRALQLIAFMLSWLRALYTVDQKLQLGEAALQQLKQWTSAATESDSTSQMEEENPEIKLAQTLLDDFTSPDNMPSAKDTVKAENVNSNSMIITNIQSVVLTDSGPISTEERELPNLKPPSSGEGEITTVTKTAADWKSCGNGEFKSGKFSEAIENYQNAIDLLESDSHATPTDKAILYSNIATAWWKIAQEYLQKYPELELCAEKSELESNVLSHIPDGLIEKFLASLEKSRETCKVAISLQPDNSKAIYRLASILLLEQRPLEALKVVESGIEEVNMASPSDKVGDGKVSETDAANPKNEKELLNQIRRKCIAAVLISPNSRKEGESMLCKSFNSKTIQTLKSLLAQYQIDVDLTFLEKSMDSFQSEKISKESKKKSVHSAKSIGTGTSRKKAGTETTAALSKRIEEMELEHLERLMQKK